MEAASIGAFRDPQEQVECSICHKTAIYGDVFLSWWGTNKGILTCEDYMKAACGHESDKVQDAVNAMWRAVGGPDWEQSVKNALTAIRNAKP